MIKTYEAKIKLPHAMTQKVTIQADDSFRAKALLEAQYGKGCVLSIVQK